MPYSAVAALMILTTVLLSACEQQQMATLEDRSGQYYGRGSASASTAYAPSYSSTPVQAVAVDAISSTDLSAPQASIAPAPMSMPFQNASAAPAPVQTYAAAAPVSDLTWQWPVQGNVATHFGKQREGIANEGITIAATQGSAIHAAMGGEVAFVGDNVRDYGNMVILRHPNGDMSSYAHAERITVAKGMVVKQGDTIGYVGQTGRAKTPQLHFAVRSGEKAVDPLSKLPQNVASN